MRGALPPADITARKRIVSHLHLAPSEPTENKMRAENLGEPSQDTVRSDLQDNKKKNKNRSLIDRLVRAKCELDGVRPAAKLAACKQLRRQRIT